MSRVYLERTSDQGIEESDVRRALDWLGWEELVPTGARVFIKPNLTWPEHLPGVTTTPQAIEALVAVLRQRTPHIAVGESDGGYHAFTAEEAFERHGLYGLAEQYGIGVVNLSREPAETSRVTVAGRRVAVTLPRRLLRETDVFITLPVPKTHVMTGVSLGLKNQWGCLPSTMRLREHPQFDRKIVAINQLLGPRLTIFDGTHFLDGAGPMTGEAVRMNLLIAGDAVGATSAVTCKIMRIDPGKIRHFRAAREAGLFPEGLQGIELNMDLAPFIGKRFEMRRAPLDWVSLVGFRSAFFTRLFWDSAWAELLHRLLYAVRRNPLVERTLYGEAGTPPAWTGAEGGGTD